MPVISLHRPRRGRVHGEDPRARRPVSGLRRCPSAAASPAFTMPRTTPGLRPRHNADEVEPERLAEVRSHGHFSPSTSEATADPRHQNMVQLTNLLRVLEFIQKPLRRRKEECSTFALIVRSLSRLRSARRQLNLRILRMLLQAEKGFPPQRQMRKAVEVPPPDGTRLTVSRRSAYTPTWCPRSCRAARPALL